MDSKAKLSTQEVNMKKLDFRKYYLILVSLVLGICSLSFQTYGQGTVINETFYSKSLQMNRAVQIYLPEAYNQQDNTIRYPVIYWLHGAGGNSTSSPEIFGVLNDLISVHMISPVIVVKPDGSTDKNPWQSGSSWYTNSELYGNFEDYIVFDLVKFIDSAYNTIASREKRAIMGHSMGALGAMRFALKHPDVYQGVVSQSGYPDMTKLSLYISSLLTENGGAPVSSYNPGAGIFTSVFFSLSGAYSPNINNPPYYVDFPVDSMGNWIDSVWNRWLLHNCALLARNINQESDLAIYFDCGVQDETLAYPFNTGFADSLNKLGLTYEFQSYNGGHIDQFTKRLPIGLHFLDSVMNKTATDIVEQEFTSPTGFVLYQNYPNPFNPSTTLSFVVGHLPAGQAGSSFVTLKVYDVLGNEVATLVNERKPAGNYEVTWNARNLSSGVYFYKLQAGTCVKTKKMLMIK
jgi:S-formylglutathione hydrolase FrmB